jgi:hypothetical protein
MAGDWIKMRVWLRRDPRVASMADFLAHERSFMDYVSEPHRRSCNDSAYECITSDITRAITVCALLEIWGVARERGDRIDNDLVLKHCTLANLDDICSVPCIGEALEYVEWAVEGCNTDAKGRSIFYVKFPNFFAENEAPEERYKKQHAEAQARYRAKKAAESDKSVDAEGDITSDVTVTPREEKRREEVNTPPAPKGVVIDNGFANFWNPYPRKTAKVQAQKAWAKLNPSPELQAQILAALAAQCKSEQWTKDGGAFIPHASTWLNQRRWEDQLPTHATAPKADIWAGAL